jgi:asparagine synthase (glutamine-hydrolysing)
MIYNGEVYNYIELRRELEQEGRIFHTPSDAEVVLQAYEHWGVDCFERFVGMWAIAIADFRRDTLVLSRDPFGIKPLYLWARAGQLMFASDPRPLLRFAGSNNASVDMTVMSRYLRMGEVPSDDRSFIEGMHQLGAGCTAEVSLHGGTQVRVVRRAPRALPALVDITPKEAAEQLRERFLESVRLHLRSDVPVGAALSGGIDSSGIVAAMRRVAGADLDLRTFSFSADDPVIDEARFQTLVADAVGARHHVVRIEARDFGADLDDLIRVQGEPFRGPSVYAQYRVFKVARENGIVVMLDGQGADELFAGYLPFVAVRIAALLRRGNPVRAARVLRVARTAGSTPGQPVAMEKYVLDRIAPDRAASWARRRRHSSVSAAWLVGGGSTSEPGAARPRLRDGVRAEAAMETWSSSLPELLRYEDRNSMAHSLESRVPFLTSPLAQFALSLPDHVLIDDDGRTKAVLRDALQDLVPSEVLARREKIGFQPPDRAWFDASSAWVSSTLGETTTSTSCGIDINELRRHIEKLRAAGQSGLDATTFRSLTAVRWASLHDIG